jgi:hypothetical protein
MDPLVRPYALQDYLGHQKWICLKLGHLKENSKMMLPFERYSLL